MKSKILAIGAAFATALAATAAGAASLDLSRDIVAKGANPGWNLTVARGTQFTLTRAGQPAITATAPGAAITVAGATWSAKTADGRPMNVSLAAKACKIGEQDYPMTAQVEIGSETLSGCAAGKP